MTALKNFTANLKNQKQYLSVLNCNISYKLLKFHAEVLFIHDLMK